MRRRDVVAGLTVLVASRAIGQTVPMPNLDYLSPEQRAQYETMHARMMKAFAFERVETTGASALATWERLRHAGRGVPVIIGDDAQLERLADQFSMDDPAVAGIAIPGRTTRTAAAILDAASKLRFPEDLARWAGGFPADQLNAPEGKWPMMTETGGSGLTIASDVSTGKPFDRVHILLIPAAASWEVPAYLRWGDWNACPPPEYHVAALRSWHERFGVELVAINGDTMNLRAARPPENRDTALALARAQYSYCPDIVDQGVGTLSALAAILMGEWWYLWWD